MGGKRILRKGDRIRIKAGMFKGLGTVTEDQADPYSVVHFRPDGWAPQRRGVAAAPEDVTRPRPGDLAVLESRQ